MCVVGIAGAKASLILFLPAERGFHLESKVETKLLNWLALAVIVVSDVILVILMFECYKYFL